MKWEESTWNTIQLVIRFETSDDDFETVVGYFSPTELENEYFIELLAYIGSKGESEYKHWMDEFIYIPKDEVEGKPLPIWSSDISRIVNGKIYELVGVEW